MASENPSLTEIREQHSAEKVILASGVFDIVHPGHISYFEYAKSLGDITVVALWSDQHVRARKGTGRPYNTAASRLCIVRAMRCVDYAFVADGLGSREASIMPIVDELEPDFYVTSNENYGIFGECGRRDHASGRITTIVYDPNYEQKAHSTTQIAAKLGIEQ